ncbi:MAG TPA: FAD-dependent oxidoreductase [Gemmatimonadales bacterium]|nr:FAD-dependent oxidoreductase [Gemmatimonadales bacterium]
MRRDLSQLVNRSFDLLVVGAGIHGACIAWDASLRGLSVALLDSGDFGAATSANSLRIVHGGLRYLARGDFPRLLESIRERTTLLRIAPNLIEPLPVLVPTYAHSAVRGRLAYRIGLAANDLISWRRNRGLQPGGRIPHGRLVSRGECLQLFPWFPAEGLTGGALWYDARIRHPERLTLSFVCSASRHGAVPANYVRVDRLLLRDGAVEGAAVSDVVDGAAFEVRAKATVVAAGPWTRSLIASTLQRGPIPVEPTGALALNVVIGRQLTQVAVGTQARTGAAEDPVCGGYRFLFINPEQGSTLLGTWYSGAAAANVTLLCQSGAHRLLNEFNEACPGLGLTLTDVVRYQWGWLPLKGGREAGPPQGLADRPIILNHGRSDGVAHLFSVEGVKYTTARRVAERVVDQIFRDLRRASPPCRTAEEPLEESSRAAFFDPDGAMEKSSILGAVRNEMAVKLSDIVFRRSNLGGIPRLQRSALDKIAGISGTELGWSVSRREAEIDEVLRQAAVPHAVMEPVG